MKKVPVVSKHDIEKCIYGEKLSVDVNTHEIALRFRPTESLVLVLSERLPKLKTIYVTNGIYNQIGHHTMNLMKARKIELKTTKFATKNEVTIKNEV